MLVIARAKVHLYHHEEENETKKNDEKIYTHKKRKTHTHETKRTEGDENKKQAAKESEERSLQERKLRQNEQEVKNT